MRSATQCAPLKCQCGAWLPKPVHSPIFPRDRISQWHMTCTCHTTYVWSWHPAGACWKIRSDMPLFDTRAIVVIA